MHGNQLHKAGWKFQYCLKRKKQDNRNHNETLLPWRLSIKIELQWTRNLKWFLASFYSNRLCYTIYWSWMNYVKYSYYTGTFNLCKKDFDQISILLSISDANREKLPKLITEVDISYEFFKTIMYKGKWCCTDMFSLYQIQSMG